MLVELFDVLYVILVLAGFFFLFLLLCLSLGELFLGVFQPVFSRGHIPHIPFKR